MIIRCVWAVSLTFVLLVSPNTVLAEGPCLSLPDAADVRELTLTGPSSKRGAGGASEELMRALADHNSNWRPDAEMPNLAYVLSLDVGKKKPLVIRLGAFGDSAYLQTEDIAGGKHVREIDIPGLSRLLKPLGADPYVVLYRQDRGYLKRVVEEVLERGLSIKARKIDKAGVRKLLDSAFHYVRSHPEDTWTACVLTGMHDIVVEEFAKDWYALRLCAEGGHRFASLLANKNGEAMPSTPEDCLRIYSEKHPRGIGSLTGARTVCRKILAGSERGVIINRSSDIPGYDKNPLPLDKARAIHRMAEYRFPDRTEYRFYSYQQLRGIVWKCKLTVDNKTRALDWEMHEVATRIGAAHFIM